MKKAAGILLYRTRDNILQFFLVHPGGPFWKNKDEGAWTIPKGELNENEDPLEAAKREFLEETGMEVRGEFLPLEPVKQKSGKTVYAWACEMDIDEKLIVSNTFQLEWPPKSGKYIDVPEVDRAQWFDLETASGKINPAQKSLLHQLNEKKKATN